MFDVFIETEACNGLYKYLAKWVNPTTGAPAFRTFNNTGDIERYFKDSNVNIYLQVKQLYTDKIINVKWF